jgi:flap endonuclease-1
MGVAIRDIIAEYKTPVSWEAIPGIAAVDANNALYQFLSIIRQPDGTPLMDQQGRVTSHLSGILFRVANFLEKGIKPVFIFDGVPTEMKQATLEKRRQVRYESGVKWKEAIREGDEEEAYKQARSSSMVDDEIVRTSKRLLALMGLPTIQAPGEGEAQAAHLVSTGRAQYAVSQDYDALLFGAPVLVRNLTVSGKRKIRGRTITVNPERIVLDDVLAGLRLSREDLIKIGILTGTDFNPGIRGVGAKTGLKIVQKGEFSAKIAEKRPGFEPSEVMEIFVNPKVTDDYTLHWGHPDREGIIAMLCEEYDFSQARVEKALENITAKTGQSTLSGWFG